MQCFSFTSSQCRDEWSYQSVNPMISWRDSYHNLSTDAQNFLLTDSLHLYIRVNHITIGALVINLIVFLWFLDLVKMKLLLWNWGICVVQYMAVWLNWALLKPYVISWGIRNELMRGSARPCVLWCCWEGIRRVKRRVTTVSIGSHFGASPRVNSGKIGHTHECTPGPAFSEFPRNGQMSYLRNRKKGILEENLRRIFRKALT